MPAKLSRSPQFAKLHQPQHLAYSRGQAKYPSLWAGLRLGGMPGRWFPSGPNFSVPTTVIVSGLRGTNPDGGPPKSGMAVTGYGPSASRNDNSSNNNGYKTVLPAAAVPFATEFSAMFFGNILEGVSTNYHSMIAKGGVFPTNAQFAMGIRRTTTTTGKPFIYARRATTLLGAEHGSSVYTYGDDTVFICTMKTGSQRLYMNGKNEIDDTDAGDPGDGTDVFSIMSPSVITANDWSMAGECHAYAYWTRVLSEGERRALSVNPFMIFEAKTMDIGFVAAAPPVTRRIFVTG